MNNWAQEGRQKRIIAGNSLALSLPPGVSALPQNHDQSLQGLHPSSPLPPPSPPPNFPETVAQLPVRPAASGEQKSRRGNKGGGGPGYTSAV